MIRIRHSYKYAYMAANALCARALSLSLSSLDSLPSFVIMPDTLETAQHFIFVCVNLVSFQMIELIHSPEHKCTFVVRPCRWLAACHLIHFAISRSDV